MNPHQKGSGRYRGGRPRLDDEIDEIAVERACAGDQTVWLTPQERREAVRLLSARGVTARETARRIGVAQRTVVRWLFRLRQAA